MSEEAKHEGTDLRPSDRTAIITACNILERDLARVMDRWRATRDALAVLRERQAAHAAR